MRAANQNETDRGTPEQLLLLLDAELMAKRGKLAARRPKRTGLLVFALMLIFGLGTLALIFAQQMMLDLHERSLPSEQVSATQLR
jgi:hypothetical protein